MKTLAQYFQSVATIMRYDVISSMRSSHFRIKMRVFHLFSVKIHIKRYKKEKHFKYIIFTTLPKTNFNSHSFPINLNF